MNRYSLTHPFAVATGIAAVIAASLLAFFVFSAKDAGAQEDNVSITVEPVNVDVGDVAAGSTETSQIKIKNNGNVEVTIGAIDLDLLGLDPDDIQLVDLDTDEELLDPILGTLLAPIELDVGEEKTLELRITPDAEGTIELVLKLLDDLLGPVLEIVTVTGEARECTISGTEGNDTIPDTPADEVICGRGGNDTINATNGGDDIILGGTGNDTINMKDGVKKEFANGNAGEDLCKPKDRKDKVKSCGTRGNKRK